MNKKDFMSIDWEKVYNYYRDNKVTQEELGNVLGVSKQCVSFNMLLVKKDYEVNARILTELLESGDITIHQSETKNIDGNDLTCMINKGYVGLSRTE